MDQSQVSLDDLYAKLAIDDEEEGGVIVQSGEIEQVKESFILVGRFLTEKNVKFNVMQNVLSSIWRPKEGVEIHDIGEMRYTFVFYHPLDMQKVLDAGPWSFEQGMLVYKQLVANEDPKEVELNEVDIWVQVYDVPQGFVSENILRSIGNFIGGYVQSDQANFNGMWKPYVRIRVKMNVTRPLKRRMKIKREGGNWSWINFRYERLSTFCFVCGILGHSERDCNVVYANPGKEFERAYGTWLRAPGKNNNSQTGSRWLRNGGGSKWVKEDSSNTEMTTGEGEERTGAKFKEADGVVSGKFGDKGMITVKTKNQGEKDMGGSNFNESDKDDFDGNNNIVIDSKRRRTETNLKTSELGPTNMQTDGLDELGLNVSKNGTEAGPGIQARLEQ